MTDLASMWSRHREELLKALELCGGVFTERDIVDGLVCGEYQMFERRNAAVIVSVQDYPQSRSVHIFLAGGDLADLIVMEKDVIEWGRTKNCDRVEWSGRRGWLRKLKGYTELCTVACKEI